MKIQRILLITAGIALVFGTMSCRDKSRKEAIAAERERWETSLKDSLKLFEKQLEEAEKALPRQREEVGRLLNSFTFVNNPREVEGYYIYTPANMGYPLASTGISARLTEAEHPEVIAALNGGRFNTIRLISGESSVTSETVPYDQALNYCAGGLNTVAFTGSQADSLLNFVLEHSSGSLTIEFMNPSIVKSAKVPDMMRETLVETARLVEARKTLRKAEASIPALSRKIQRLKCR